MILCRLLTTLGQHEFIPHSPNENYVIQYEYNENRASCARMSDFRLTLKGGGLVCREKKSVTELSFHFATKENPIARTKKTSLDCPISSPLAVIITFTENDTFLWPEFQPFPRVVCDSSRRLKFRLTFQ